jgi:hypothetical protein
MNNSGSTTLHSYLKKCENAISLPKKSGLEHISTSFEGHLLAKEHMPTPNDLDIIAIFSEKQDIFEDSKNYNWSAIRKTWNSLWKESCEWDDSGMVLLEKSPPDLLRARLLEKNFSNSYFLVMVRNPYAVIEGMNRRYGHSLESGAKHWCRTASKNIYNINNLDNVVYFTYEQMCDNHSVVSKKISNILPELYDLDFGEETDGVHSIDGYGKRGLINFNKKQISRFDTRHFNIINSVLKKNKNILHFFGYNIINNAEEYREL